MGGGGEGGGNNPFTKTICSICYEDLKPLIEDLQSISVCGHVFHELCLQQWFEYCPKGKKKSCPVCKQSCTNPNVSRLYFQSVGDPNDSQKPRGNEEIPEELRGEVIRLEGKANALAFTVEQQQEQLKKVQEQLLMNKEQLEAEVVLKNEALTQKMTVQKLLRMKSEELDKSILERMRVQERNMALAKELAALKLASDLNLDDEEVMKLASFGNAAGSKETVDVLRKSLILRNKSYKELMAKCQTLGRGEAQGLRKLEKANKKIEKLILRVQELEVIIEKKGNEALRVLKDQDSKFKASLQGSTMKGSAVQANFDKAADIPDNSFCSRKVEPFKPMLGKSTIDDITPANTYNQNGQQNISSLVNEEEGFIFSPTQIHVYENSLGCTDNSADKHTSHGPKQDSILDVRNRSDVPIPCSRNGASDSRAVKRGRESDEAKEQPTDIDDDVICYSDTNQAHSSFQIRKESGPSVPFVQPGGYSFSGGLVGPDGTNWHLGKWCKKSQNSGSSAPAGLQGSNAKSGDLIAVGADGRGGRIKVMRSLDRSSDITEASPWAKKCKNGAKTHSLQQPQGSLQIEHFFQRKS